MDKLFFGAGETVSRNFFLFVLGVVKSISANGKNCTLLNNGGSHVQGSDVEECYCFTRVLASAGSYIYLLKIQYYSVSFTEEF